MLPIQASPSLLLGQHVDCPEPLNPDTWIVRAVRVLVLPWRVFASRFGETGGEVSCQRMFPEAYCSGSVQYKIRRG